MASSSTMKTIAAYVKSIAAVTVAVLLRAALHPILGDAVPLVMLFGAVAAAVWMGGWGPALLVTLGGYAACAWLFILPRGDVDLADASLVVGFIAYGMTCAVIIAIGEAMRRAQMRDSRRRAQLEVTLASVGDGVITCDAAGNVTDLNSVAEMLTEWPPEDAAGKSLYTVLRLIDEETRVPIENPARTAFRDSVVSDYGNHMLLVSKSGVEIPIDARIAAIRDDENHIVGCLLVFRDVTGRRRVERANAARLTKARLMASILESYEDAVVSMSLDGIVETWNAAAQRLFGYRADQILGRPLSLIIPPERADEEKEVAGKLRRGEEVERFETTRLHKDGTHVAVSIAILPVRDEAGRLIGAAGVVRKVAP